MGPDPSSLGGMSSERLCPKGLIPLTSGSETKTQ